MSQEWGKTLKKLRLRAGFSQGEFADSLSKLNDNLPKDDVDQLMENGIETIILDNSELSRYENGRRLPRLRSRFISLIYALVKFDGLESVSEANEWLSQADQAPLTDKEINIIFGTAGEVSEETEPIQPEPEEEEIPVGVTMPQFAMWVGMFAVVILLLGVIYALLLDVGPLQTRVAGSIDEAQKTDPVQAKPEDTEEIAEVEEEDALSVELDEEPEPELEEQSSPAVINLGDFTEDYGEWLTGQFDGEIQVSLKNGKMCGDITDGAAHPFTMRWWREGIALEEYGKYQLTFEVTSTVDRNIDLFVSHRDMFRTYYHTTFPVTTGSQQISLDFDQFISDPTASLNFLMGGQPAGEVCIDNFTLEKIGTFEPVTDLAQEAGDEASMLDTQSFRSGWLESWALNHATETTFSMYFEDQSACFDINANGSHVGSVNLRHFDINLELDQDYFVSADVTSSSNEAQVNTWMGSSLYETWTLETGSQTVSHEYTSTAKEPDQYFLFNMSGPDGTTICVSDIVFKPIN